jgi:signal transduction histidine kinase/HAMP domain-containing protein
MTNQLWYNCCFIEISEVIIMFSLRNKLAMGFGGILVIVAGIGLLIMSQLTTLGNSIDVILRENYRCVVACQNMKEALERIDSGILFNINGNPNLGNTLIANNLVVFNRELNVEKHNITLPGEQALVDSLIISYSHYQDIIRNSMESKQSFETRKSFYYRTLLPQFNKTKELAQKTLELNQNNMSQENNQAREEAGVAKTRMLIVILTCGLMALLFSFLTRIWVLKPINRLIESVGEVSSGNLELVLHNNSNDEIGKLAKSFNKMTEALREKKRSDSIELQQTKQMTKEVISAISTAVAITDKNGNIEIATDSAQKLLRMKIGSSIFDTKLNWLPELYKKAISSGSIAEYPADRGYIQTFNEFQEYFYQPVVLPLTFGNENHQSNGAVILFRDMTQLQEQQELKQSVVSTVSHQLKTPLTSLRMSIHLLFDEQIGLLNEKQTELLQAAKEEAERLTGIVGGLLDIHRLSNDSELLDKKLLEPETLISKAVSPYIAASRDKGIELKTDVPAGLPNVMVDTARFSPVFENLLDNALRYTSPGGRITVSVTENGDWLRFIIKDTGIGIPSEYQDRIFEQFYRVPGAENSSGAGLGLAIVREIVLAHDGKVGMESVPGQGSDFWFELPASRDKMIKVPIKPNGGI